jgi:hypothetical protein
MQLPAATTFDGIFPFAFYSWLLLTLSCLGKFVQN